MAVDDISYINVFGEEVSRNYLLQQMIGLYNLKLKVGDTKVTDFSDGSEIRNLLESIAVDHYIILEEQNELTKIGFPDTAYGEWLDKHGASPFINIARNIGKEAVGEVEFKIPDVMTSEVIIPEGTVIINSETGLEYTTDFECTIPIGETSNNVLATCLTVGTDGNCDIGKIDLIDEDEGILRSVTVSNITPMDYGEDYEEDEVYRQKVLGNIRRTDFGSRPYYLDLAKKVDGVHDVVITSEVGYTGKVLVNGYTKPAPNNVILNVLELFTDTSNVVFNHNFTVSAVNINYLYLNIDLGVKVEIDEDLVKEVVTKYFDGGNVVDGAPMEFLGFDINQKTSITEIENVLKLINNVLTATVSVEGYDDDEIVPEHNKVLQAYDITIEQTIVEG